MLVAVFAMAACGMACEKSRKRSWRPPPEVYVAPVIQQDVPVYLELVGQTEGFQDVEIRARVEGFLETVNFREGSFVKQGDLLYRSIGSRSRRFWRQRKADQATAEARLAKANNDVARYTPLVAKQAVSQQELDNALAEQDAARSQVEAAKAAVEKATLDLSYTRITSPISGLDRDHAGQGGQSRRTRREHAADHGLADRSRCSSASASPKPTTCAIARRAAGAATGAGPARPGGDRADAGRRHDAIRRPVASTPSSAPSIRPPAPSGSSCVFPNPAADPAAGPVRRVRGSCSRPSRARCSFRSAPCRNCRISTASPWWTTRQGRVSQREGRASAWTRSGSSRTGSRPESRSSSKAFSGFRTA